MDYLDFCVFPAVVLADRVSKISIFGNGEKYKFYDDVSYKITVCAKEYHDVPIDDDFTIAGYDYKEIIVKPNGGVIEFEYLFSNEQKWDIHISALSNQVKYLNEIQSQYGDLWDNKAAERGYDFSIYSLKSDLYGKIPFKGDLHIHSNYSDAADNPEIAMANLRRYGYDFSAVTDHHYYDSSLIAVDKFNEIKTNFKVYPGEEVHNKISGRFHIVNFGGKYSINKIILSDREAFKNMVSEKASRLKNIDEKDAIEVAWYQAITEEIRKSDGMAIFAHPFWDVGGAYNCPTNIIYEVIDREFYDAYEILGGVTPYDNNLQVAIYNELRAKGYNIPIVGTTDSHQTHHIGMDYFALAHTLVFANNEDDILNSIKELNSVAVETLKNEYPRVYGPFRLVKYALFLLENYYPMHNRLCKASGTLLCEYFKGDEYLKEAVEMCERKIKDFENKFFGFKNNKG